MPNDTVLTVSALNMYLKSVFDSDSNLQNVFLKGQISGFVNNVRSGHYYMTLKDEKSEIKAAMFRQANQRLKFMPENDMNVIVRGRVAVYDVRGEYRIYIDDMQPDGTGALAIAFEQMKKRLEFEGLFDESHKKPIPRFPKIIGVVTSETGAAVRDIINIIGRRYPLAEILLYPVSVQGNTAAGEIALAVKYMSEHKSADVLIVGRGGGSVEDLWAFNEEVVARAVFNCRIPVISAVGHETDFTICDFVADKRAPTPSAAAELAVPDIRDLSEKTGMLRRRMENSVQSYLADRKAKLVTADYRIKGYNPVNYIENLSLRYDSALMRIQSASEALINDRHSSLNIVISKLEGLNPLRVLQRGYTAVTRDGKCIKSSSELSCGDEISVRFHDGSVRCEVKDNG